ncbi:MAG: formylglycine-generating enzyme family protein [Chloroflexi bacterium]|nr:formylglycine-generating enzyme family protein [Chloroflexota bacterium]
MSERGTRGLAWGALAACALWGLVLGVWAHVAAAPQAPMAWLPVIANPRATPTSTASRTPQPSATPSPTATPTPLGDVLVLAPGVELSLVRVPSGSFVMGSTDSDQEAEQDEKPQHSVYLDAYQIGRYEVTVAQWRAFVDAAGYLGHVRALEDPDDHPVRWVSWFDADAFCAWASQVTGRVVHLPTEAQWEKAARGADGRLFPWGDNRPFCLLCNVYRCVNNTSPVGSCSPQGDSLYGCSDVAGNLWEWTFDYYDWFYYSQPGPWVNPTGPTSGYYRGARGGSWSYVERDVRCANRHMVSAPFARDEYVGFRVAVADD